MVATAYDALGATELALEELQVLAARRNAQVRARLRAINVRLTKMRRRLRAAARRFERIGQEIGQVKGLVLTAKLFRARIQSAQPSARRARRRRRLDGEGRKPEDERDDLRLTVVATIFLPVDIQRPGGLRDEFAGWMIGEIELRPRHSSRWGGGGPVVSTFLIWRRDGGRRERSPAGTDERRSRRLSHACSGRAADRWDKRGPATLYGRIKAFRTPCR
jgi:hypothetical protein